jgi:hypothetical protein
MCHRVTMYALSCVTTDNKFYPSSFVMDVLTNVYPRVKEAVRQFKPDHDYQDRKTHALITYIAAYFANVQTSRTANQTILFDLPRFYKHFAAKRDIRVSLAEFDSQVD